MTSTVPPSSSEDAPSVDRLSSVLERFRVSTQLFHTGTLCGLTTFDAQPGRGFLHVLRAGEIGIRHRSATGREDERVVTAPSLLFYPRPLEHTFDTGSGAGVDFACAAIDIAGGSAHPLMRTLPDVVVLSVDRIPTLAPTLDLLFAEVDAVQCGRRLVADRLFEVVLIQLFRWILDHPDGLGLPAGLLTGLADRTLAPALVAVHAAPGEPWTVAAMARESAMSRSAFAARFAHVVGQPPLDYLTDWRMTLAQDALDSGQSVGRTAVDLGYATPAAFSRAFAQRVGRSPRAWAQARRNAQPSESRPSRQGAVGAVAAG